MYSPVFTNHILGPDYWVLPRDKLLKTKKTFGLVRCYLPR